ncbi:MAG: hypothetical protein A3A86_03175 [Elusimicrobia bacterium RIFCSPLOWO2_01_FULL_60_11]|nr:MAG: hypothetical protein A3A86_03175 [Elusimicrobia bacterium RIFCSPLOWO2_01_FULL_60_11]
MPGIQKFVFYSFSIHTALVGGFIFRQVFSNSSKEYYAVDFYSPADAQDVGNGRDRSLPPKIDSQKETVVNPKEDLLLKSKDKKKKKEKVSAIPIPIPKAPAPKGEAGDESDLPSAVPDAVDGSGVGVGFGKDGWKGGGSGAGNFPYQWYVQTIKKNLDGNWNITGGFSRRIYTQVAFTITRDGSLADVEVEEKSGNDVFDYQAKRAVSESGPFPPLPGDFHESELRVHVRFTVKR